MFLCECVTPCTLIGQQGKPVYYERGSRKTFDKCPKHFRILQELDENHKDDNESGLPEFTDKDEAEAYAKEHFHADLDKRWSLNRMVLEIENLNRNAR
jgi:hypothetical protein